MCYRSGRPVDYAGQDLGDFELADTLCCGMSRAQFYRQYGEAKYGPVEHPFAIFQPEEDVWKHKKRG